MKKIKKREKMKKELAEKKGKPSKSVEVAQTPQGNGVSSKPKPKKSEYFEIHRKFLESYDETKANMRKNLRDIQRLNKLRFTFDIVVLSKDLEYSLKSLLR